MSNPYTAPAIFIGVILIGAIIAGYYIATERTRPGPDYTPRHTHQPRHTHRPAPLPTAGRLPMLPESPVAPLLLGRPEPDWWDRTPATTARLLEALRDLDTDDPGECADCGHCLCDCEPDTTRTELHAVNTWGGTAVQVADKLAEEYLT